MTGPGRNSCKSRGVAGWVAATPAAAHHLQGLWNVLLSLHPYTCILYNYSIIIYLKDGFFCTLPGNLADATPRKS